ncbi:hypothetical protein BS78_04G030000 [Paspalum vaginatum]|nr:hypothetical protein BS78_04G030000 [Paspalum vaginatum]
MYRTTPVRWHSVSVLQRRALRKARWDENHITRQPLHTTQSSSSKPSQAIIKTKGFRSAIAISLASVDYTKANCRAKGSGPCRANSSLHPGHMALQAQQASPSPSPSPRRSPPDRAPPTPPTRELPDPEKGDLPAAPDSTAIVIATTHHAAAAARYVPPRAESRTADPDPARSGGGGGWYSWNGGRSSRHARRPRPDPPPPKQRPPEAVVAAHAPPPPPPPAPASPPPAPAPQAPAPAPAQPHPQFRSADDRVVPHILSRKRRVAAMQRTALVARGAAAGLCLAALAVLAADTRKGWALDSYSNYSQFRYSEAVNVIGFLYSIFQFAALAGLMRKNKHLIPHPKRDLFDFTMDQVLAYLLISSSSSATARVSDLIDNWGSDPFPSMANGSIAISFLAFVVFAICSLISAYNLFRRDM